MKTKLAVLLTAIMFLTCVNVGTVEAASNKAANKKMTYDEYVTYLTGLAEIEEARFGSIDADTGDYGRINSRAAAVSGAPNDDISARGVLEQLAKLSPVEQDRFMECLYDPSTWKIGEPTVYSYAELVDGGVPNTTNGSGGDPNYDGRFQYGDYVRVWDTDVYPNQILGVTVQTIIQDCAGYLYYDYKFDRITKYDAYIGYNLIPTAQIELEYINSYISKGGYTAYGEFRMSYSFGPIQDFSIQIGNWVGKVRANADMTIYYDVREE